LKILQLKSRLCESVKIGAIGISSELVVASEPLLQKIQNDQRKGDAKREEHKFSDSDFINHIFTRPKMYAIGLLNYNFQLKLTNPHPP
jgi:hypothetical protein